MVVHFCFDEVKHQSLGSFDPMINSIWTYDQEELQSSQLSVHAGVCLLRLSMCYVVMFKKYNIHIMDLLLDFFNPRLHKFWYCDNLIICVFVFVFNYLFIFLIEFLRLLLICVFCVDMKRYRSRCIVGLQIYLRDCDPPVSLGLNPQGSVCRK